MTPEGKIKQKVKDLLTENRCYFFMPVQTGYGAAGLDFHCVAPGGKAFFVETKAEDKDLTDRQIALGERLTKLGAPVFVIYDDASLDKLRMWLE